jgi:hypothetical protein
MIVPHGDDSNQIGVIGAIGALPISLVVREGGAGRGTSRIGVDDWKHLLATDEHRRMAAFGHIRIDVRSS